MFLSEVICKMRCYSGQIQILFLCLSEEEDDTQAGRDGDEGEQGERRARRGDGAERRL